MRVSIHVLVSVIICALLFPFYGWNVLFVIVGGVLIDIDHYLRYISLFKDVNLINAFKHHNSKIINAYKHHNSASKNTEYKGRDLCIFHTIEFLLLLAILSYFSIAFLLITIGVLIHYLLDIISQVYLFKRIVMEPSILLWAKKTILEDKKF